ncbi:MAG: hypothetical protein IJB24_04365 [Clostridia bacterium]|nr:hypothetical protein [Clostridia bacterium]MBQ4602076.1 hypothetical protein [Clostridia bacterium]
MKNNTKKLALAAVLSALCFIMLLLGSVITVLDLSTAAAASFIIIFCVIELGGYYPYLMWLTVSFISLLMLPDKFGALVFTLFTGIYPILKSYIERLPKTFAWLVKLVIFNVILTLIITASRFVLGIPAEEIDFSFIVYGICNITFILYDIAATRLISLYLFKLRKRFKFINKQ